MTETGSRTETSLSVGEQFTDQQQVIELKSVSLNTDTDTVYSPATVYSPVSYNQLTIQ